MRLYYEYVKIFKMELAVVLVLVVPTAIHSKVVVFEQDASPYRRGIVWTPYNTTSCLWFLPFSEGVTITARYNDGVGDTYKKHDKNYDARTGLWTKISHTIVTESSKSILELHFVNSIDSKPLRKFNIKNHGEGWNVHLTYANGTVMWAEQDPGLVNNAGLVYGGNGNILHTSSRYESLPHSNSDTEECSCVLTVFLWLLGIFLLIAIVVALVVFIYKFMKNRSGSDSVLNRRSSKYQVTVTRSSLNNSNASRLSGLGLQSKGNAKYLAKEEGVTKPYETTLSPLMKANSRPQSTPIATPARNSRPQSQMIISEKHPVPCNLVVHPPTPPPEELVFLGRPTQSMASLQPSAASHDDFDDFSSCSARSSADGDSVNSGLNTKF
ncbi:unnamed protein product [Meganyctiphanes norvegica]|uniref:Uncharacterized protein n=1 Tax=Meganyctiphanes norvegica TaxID=48144 RepID=A0AAV2S9E4_MEGNR